MISEADGAITDDKATLLIVVVRSVGAIVVGLCSGLWTIGGCVPKCSGDGAVRLLVSRAFRLYGFYRPFS